MKRNDYDRIPVGPLVQPNPPWARIVLRQCKREDCTKEAVYMGYCSEECWLDPNNEGY